MSASLSAPPTCPLPDSHTTSRIPSRTRRAVLRRISISALVIGGSLSRMAPGCSALEVGVAGGAGGGAGFESALLGFGHRRRVAADAEVVFDLVRGGAADDEGVGVRHRV